jgi:GWxTD domain-containing protein
LSFIERESITEGRFLIPFSISHQPSPITTLEHRFSISLSIRLSENDVPNRRFTVNGIPGWKTDRGRVLIQWGLPDEMESHPEGATYMRVGALPQSFNFPYEMWLYRYIEGRGPNVMVQFVDPAGTGNFVKAEPR